MLLTNIKNIVLYISNTQECIDNNRYKHDLTNKHIIYCNLLVITKILVLLIISQCYIYLFISNILYHLSFINHFNIFVFSNAFQTNIYLNVQNLSLAKKNQIFLQ